MRIARSTSFRALVFVGMLAGVARPAVAGPPFLCHPFEIGTARSLPWEQSNDFWRGRADYDAARLVDDTMALLTPDMPVLVRMETLRRATFYALRDKAIAASLMIALKGRAEKLERLGQPDALAWFDAAYLAEAYREVRELGYMTPVAHLAHAADGLTTDGDGRALLQKALMLRPADPSIAFAASLVASAETRTLHLKSARDGASRDPLLAANLDRLYPENRK